MQIARRTVRDDGVPGDDGDAARAVVRIDPAAVVGREVGFPKPFAGCQIERFDPFSVGDAMEDDDTAARDRGTGVALSEGNPPAHGRSSRRPGRRQFFAVRGTIAMRAQDLRPIARAAGGRQGRHGDKGEREETEAEEGSRIHLGFSESMVKEANRGVAFATDWSRMLRGRQAAGVRDGRD